MNARKIHRGEFGSRPRPLTLTLPAAYVAALTLALAAPVTGQNLGQRSFCGGTPSAANSLGGLKVRWTTSLELYFTPSLSHPAPGINDPNNPASVALPEQRADTVQYLPSAGTPERVVFSRTVVAAGHTIAFNGDFRPAFASYPGRAVLDVQIDGGPGVRYLQDDISDMQFTAELAPPSVSGVCKGEQWYSKLTLRPTGGPRSTQITGTWRVVGQAEYTFAPNQGTFDFTADPNKFEASIGVTNTTLHAGSRQFTVEVTGTSPDGCLIALDQAPSPVSLHVQTATCALTGVDFEAGQTVGVPIEIVNPCVVTLRGTWTLSGGEAHYDTPKSEQFAIPPKGRLRKSVPIKNNAQHGAPVTFTFDVQPVEALPCSSTAQVQFQPPQVTRIDSIFTTTTADNSQTRTAAYLSAPVVLDPNFPPVVEAFTFTIDWRGHPAGSLRYSTPLGDASVPVAGNTVTIAPVMNLYLPGFKLDGQAVSSDTSASRKLRAGFDVVSVPVPFLKYGWKYAVSADPNKRELKYESNKVDWTCLKSLLPASLFPKPLPGQGGQQFDWKTSLATIVKVSGTKRTSSVDTALKKEAKDKETQKLKGEKWPTLFGLNMKKAIDKLPGFVRKFDYGAFFKALWSNKANQTNWKFDGGTVGVSGAAGIAAPPEPVEFWVGPVLGIPIPLYAQGKFDAEAEITGTISGLTDPNGVSVTTSLEIKPTGTGIIGLGRPKVVGVEGHFSLGAELGFQLPTAQPPTGWGVVKKFDFVMGGKLKFVSFLFSLNVGFVKCTYALVCNANCFSCDYGFGGFRGLPDPQPLEREYLRDRDAFAVFDGAPSVLRGGGGVQETLLVANEFPYASPDISHSGTTNQLAWITDDPNRASLDRSLAVFSRAEPNVWAAPRAVADDGTADFQPVIRGVGAAGDALIAWVNSNTLLDPNSSYDQQVSTLDIAVTRYGRVGDSFEPQLVVTGNGYLDHRPRLAVAGDGTALLVWVANAFNALVGSAAQPNQLMYARYNGSAWSAAQVAAADVPSVISLCVAYNGVAGAIVYSGDASGTLQADDVDEELYLLTFDGASWSSPLGLTADGVIDTNPQAAYTSLGDLLIVWSRGRALVSATQVDLSDLRTIFESDQISPDFTLASGDADDLAVVWTASGIGLSNLWYARYDAAGDRWNAPRTLSVAAGGERDMALSFDAAGRLMAAVLRDQLGVEPHSIEWEGVTYNFDVPIVESTDLYVLARPFVSDLAIDPNEVTLDPANPAPGGSATIRALIANLGDGPVSNVEVAVYDGDPNGGGVLIDTAVIAGPIDGGADDAGTVSWTVPAGTTSRTLYVVVDPNSALADADRANNVATKVVLVADVVVDELLAEAAGCDQTITVRALNQGAIPSAPTTLTLHEDDPNGAILTTLNVPALAAGEGTSFTFLYANPTPGPAGAVVVAVVDLPDADENGDRVGTLPLDLIPAGLTDCDGDGWADACQIAAGGAADLNNNAIPDSCERLYVDAAATGTGDGSSWADAFTKLQDALAVAADPNRGVQEVWVAAATYRPGDPNGPRGSAFALPSGVRVYGGFASGETSLAQRDPNANPTILSGDLNADDTPGGNRGDNAYHVVVADGASDATVLDGFVILGGAADAPGADERGGGLWIENGAPTIRNCLIVGNEALNGGGVSLSNTAARLVNCALSGNAASENGGGVWFMGGAPELINCTLAGNSATGDGGGLWTDSAAAALTSCILWGNGDQNGSGELAQVFVSAGGVAVNYTCIQGLTGGLGGTGNLGGDPLFVNAAGLDGVVGTPDDNLRLAAGSPCIDAGDSLALPADADDLDADSDTAEGVPIDLAGRPRRVDDPATADTGNGPPPVVDLGAYEHQPGRSKQRIPQHQQAPAQF